MQHNKVYFTNPGFFDIKAMLTFGLSAKESDSAIGFFGTGFKYAVAIILRNLGSIKITTKDDKGTVHCYSFVTRRHSTRGQDFDVVHLVDHIQGTEREAGFTTRLGINWEGWMAFRELYCNTVDEGGSVSCQYSAADTIIEVECLAVSDALSNKDSYILSGEPSFCHYATDIHDKPSEYVYYRGIAIAKMEAAMTYNLKGQVELTEDRTVRYDHQVRFAVQRAIQSCDKPRLVRKAIANGKHYEAQVGFDIDWPVSDCFQAECRAMLKTNEGVCESARKLINSLQDKNREFEPFQLNKVQRMAFEKAVLFLAKIDIPISQYPVNFVDGLGKGVMGRALDGQIYIGPLAFDMGVKQLASTLMEEWVHIKTGAADFDRVMQNWLFDKILSIGESIAGEPI